MINAIKVHNVHIIYQIEVGKATKKKKKIELNMEETKMLIPCHTLTRLNRDENFELNLNITSQARGLNLGPSMNVSNGVFFLNTDATLCLRRFDSFPDHSSATFGSGFFRVKLYDKGLIFHKGGRKKKMNTMKMRVVGNGRSKEYRMRSRP